MVHLVHVSSHVAHNSSSQRLATNVELVELLADQLQQLHQETSTLDDAQVEHQDVLLVLLIDLQVDVVEQGSCVTQLHALQNCADQVALVVKHAIVFAEAGHERCHGLLQLISRSHVSQYLEELLEQQGSDVVGFYLESSQEKRHTEPELVLRK